MAAAQAAGKSASNVIRSCIQRQVMEFPTRNALRVAHQNIRWNFSQLENQTVALASGLADIGVKSGDTVASTMGRSAELVALSLGAGFAGYSVATAPCAISAAGITKMLHDTKSKVLVVDTHAVQAAKEALSKSSFPNLQYVLHTGRHKEAGLLRFSDIMLYYALPDRLSEVEVSDVSSFLVDVSSSGSLGKSVSFGEAMGLADSKASGSKIQNTSNVLYASKDGSGSDLILSSLACISKNAHFVIPSEKYDAAVLPDIIEQDRCDIKLA